MAGLVGPEGEPLGWKDFVPGVRSREEAVEAFGRGFNTWEGRDLGLGLAHSGLVVGEILLLGEGTALGFGAKIGLKEGLKAGAKAAARRFARRWAVAYGKALRAAGMRRAAIEGMRFADEASDSVRAARKVARNAPNSKPADIALGLDTIDGRRALDEFAQSTGAVRDKAWKDLGLHNAPPGRFDIAFQQSLDNAVAGGGRIKFNLDSLDIPKTLAGNPAERVGRYTEWELQQIVRNQKWLDSTDFYLNGKILTPAEVQNLGLR